MKFDMSQLEETNCPLCNQSGQAKFKFDPFGVKECASCDIHFLSPRLTEQQLLNFYRSDSYFGENSAYGEKGYINQEKALVKTYRSFLENFKDKASGGTMLEIGCGSGFFLQEAKPYFSQMDAIEFSAAARNTARHYCGQIYSEGLGKLGFSDKYDFVFAHQVIEHIYDPRNFLDEIQKSLKVGGKICLSTPDIGSFWIHLLGKKWPSFKIPEHVIFYTADSLCRLLGEAGFKDVHPIPFGHAFPLGIILEKLRIQNLGSEAINSWPIWIPKTVLGVVGQKK